MGDLGSDSSSKTENKTQNAQVALNAGGIGVSSSSFANSPISITTADPEIVGKGIDLARGVSNASYETVIYTLKAFEAFQNRALQSVERATDTAQTIALQATPVSPGVYAEASAGQFKQMLLVAGGGAVVLALILRKK